MALKIRLARGGAKKRPFYRIVVAEASAVTLAFDFTTNRVVNLPESILDYIKEVDSYQLPHVKERLAKLIQ